MASDDRWSVATGEIEGKPLIVRIRNEAPPYAGKADFPKLMAVQWNYQAPNEQGMPSPEAVERMSQLEDLLSAALEGACQAFLAVITTGNGVREWQWYVRDSQSAMKLVNAALKGHQRFPIQIIVDDDPGWEAYERFQAITAA